jgi:hypothetical protein
VEQAARLLGLTLTDTARLIVSGELAVSVPAGVPLDDVSIRVVGSRLRALLDGREAFRFSSVDRSEANRIFGRKYSLRGWPPAGWSPGSSVSDRVGHDDILNVVDNPSIIVEWLNRNGQYDSRVSDMANAICGVRGQMSRREFDVALAELERLDVLQVVGMVTGGRGPRPRVARLRMWFYNALRAGRPMSIAEVRARVEG